jgi:hypothetical protein
MMDGQVGSVEHYKQMTLFPVVALVRDRIGFSRLNYVFYEAGVLQLWIEDEYSFRAVN